MNKKKKIILTIVILLITITVIGVSYALWVLKLTQTGENDIAFPCFNIIFIEKDNIHFPKNYPL